MKYDDTFAKQMRERGYSVRTAWQMKGPENTLISGMECLIVTGNGCPMRLFIVETLEDDGWEVFSDVSRTIEVGETIDACEAHMRTA